MGWLGLFWGVGGVSGESEVAIQGQSLHRQVGLHTGPSKRYSPITMDSVGGLWPSGGEDVGESPEHCPVTMVGSQPLYLPERTSFRERGPGFNCVSYILRCEIVTPNTSDCDLLGERTFTYLTHISH